MNSGYTNCSSITVNNVTVAKQLTISLWNRENAQIVQEKNSRPTV